MPRGGQREASSKGDEATPSNHYLFVEAYPPPVIASFSTDFVRDIGEKPHAVIANDPTFRNGVSAQPALGASNLSGREMASPTASR